MGKRTLFTLFGLFTFALVISMTHCKSVKNTTVSDLDRKSSVENFDAFYTRFNTDSLFQMARIKFPLKGIKVDWEGKKEWTVKNWITLKTKIADIDTTEFKVDFKKTDNSFTQKFWLENSGYSSEYRFNVIQKKWHLVYANEQNL